MSSKEKILAAIRSSKPVSVSLPAIPLFNETKLPLLETFAKVLESSGGKVIVISKDDNINPIVYQLFPTAASIASTISEMPGTVDLIRIRQPIEMEGIEVAIMPSRLAVAENGAVWLSEKEFMHRALPFITEHLIIVINKNSIVQNMHEAYQKIQVDETGFGVFIAGPSKTADIEQSLVIGAQAARSFTVIVIE